MSRLDKQMLYVKPQTERDYEESNLAFFQTSYEDRGKVEELSTGVPPIIKKVARKMRRTVTHWVLTYLLLIDIL